MFFLFLQFKICFKGEEKKKTTESKTGQKVGKKQLNTGQGKIDQNKPKLDFKVNIGPKVAKQNSLLKTKTNLLRQNMGYTRKTNLLMQKRSDQANSIDLFRLKMSKRDNSGWYWTKKEAKHLICY